MNLLGDRSEAGSVPSSRRLRTDLDRLRTRPGTIPAVAVAVAVVAAILLPEVDARKVDEAVPLLSAGPSTAAAVLTTVASAAVTIAALTFSIAMLAIQLASQQYSPRVVREFLVDRITQWSLATFLATFVYSLLTLRSVRAPDEVDAVAPAGVVPSVGLTVAFLLGLASIGMLAMLVSHISRSLRVASIITRVTSSGLRAIDRDLGVTGSGLDAALRAEVDDPWQEWPPSSAARLIRATSSGYVVDIELDRIARIARAADVHLHVLVGDGDFVPAGIAVAAVHPGPRAEHDVEQGDAKLEDDRVFAAIVLEEERSATWDVSFALRQLVDIADRALSPGVNDPTTAVMALDRVHQLLRDVASRSLPREVERDEDGRARAWVRGPSWDGLVGLGLDEVRRSGRGSLQVQRRMRAIIDDLLVAAPEHRHAPLLRRREALDADLDLVLDGRGADDASARLDRELMSEADLRGM